MVHLSNKFQSSADFFLSALSHSCQFDIVGVLDNTELLLIFHKEIKMPFFLATMLLGAMLSNVYAKVFLIPLSLTLRHDVSLSCVKCGRRKKSGGKKVMWGVGVSFTEYVKAAFN